MDELLGEISRHLTCEMPNAQAKEVGRNLIGRVNAAQEEYCKYREIYPKKSQDSSRILHNSGKGESDYLILEFVKKFLSPGTPGRIDIFLPIVAMEFYIKIQDLLRDKLCEKP